MEKELQDPKIFVVLDSEQKTIFKKNLEGLTYKEKTEIRMNDLNQQIEQQDEENKKLKKEYIRYEKCLFSKLIYSLINLIIFLHFLQLLLFHL